MSYLRFVARRAAFSLLSVYLVVTATFALINVTLQRQVESRQAIARYACRGGDPEDCPSAAELERIRQGVLEAHGADAPLHERYVEWLVDVTTLEWGYSVAYRKPVVAVLDGRVQTTLEYVLPGVVLAIGLGVLFGLFAALARDGVFDWTVRLGAYGLLGVPAFMVVIYVIHFGGGPEAYVLYPSRGTIRKTSAGKHVVATVAVAVSLLAGQVRFARVSALEQAGKSFVKMLRAKGADRLLLARHVLRNAAVPIVSLSITELLAVLVLQIYVIEETLGIQGLAGATLRAVNETDIPLVIWSTMVVVLFGITGNFLQDLAYGYLDPRIRAE